MPSPVIRLNSGLLPRPTATWRQRYRTPHFRQGDWDGACGPLVVMSAMVILGLATRAEISMFRIIQDGRYEDTFFKAWEGYFYGTTDKDMLELLETLNARVRKTCRVGSMRSVCEFAIRRLALDELVIVGINPWGIKRGHWILAIGHQAVEAGSTCTTTALLCLDPAEPAPTVAPWNALLDLESPARGALHVHYRTASSIRNVTCKIAIALSKCDLQSPAGNH